MEFRLVGWPIEIHLFSVSFLFCSFLSVYCFTSLFYHASTISLFFSFLFFYLFVHLFSHSEINWYLA
ncbi:hypothetical protein BDQ94DRAFT_141391 [Aspergillus welwitschiae]|uniref:Uncharacterized protein n=1 Tax=Aspergillus welwitschiae TaxID=1341132 RepID=A0A3F3Q5E1_9EURO|nr:hypothetical protein BDQ94DRAFT_141391 [Aspergillus welwitschiae]RDH34393.1 hypothetical protein BDQ94DRAFT_141391 [Aspergillus welwitschiae]